MTQSEMFGAALWVGDGKKPVPIFSALVREFTLDTLPASAILRAVGLGTFCVTVNGEPVTEDRFLPLSTDYEPRKDYPRGELLTGHRLYVPEYDVGRLLHIGVNRLVLHFGGGWYTCTPRGAYGDAKAIYRLTIDGRDLVSSCADTITQSFVTDTDFISRETQDLRLLDAMGDISRGTPAVAARPLDTDYLFSDCPADRVCARLPVSKNDKGVYDCGANISGFPVLRLRAKAGDKVTVRCFEQLLPDGTPEAKYQHGQTLTFLSDGKDREVGAAFTWFGFRYFTVEGEADVLYAAWQHTDVKKTASFTSDAPLLNWLFETFVRTQLNNMHGGIPSDCPHLERRGYTGDGELVCPSALTVFDAKSFYRKWMEDIADGQDVRTGHIQYTAPYVASGGGPGAWGCAIVEVPYAYMTVFGDLSVAEKFYPAMLRYFSYMEAHSEHLLVTSDKEGAWCLGDWCTPADVALPAPFVNNYYYIRALTHAADIARRIGKEEDLPLLTSRIRERKDATRAAYFNTWDGNFIAGLQGANAFAVDLGIGDGRTYENLVRHYREIGEFDTGICGTDVLIRVLFEHGDGDLALDLLTSEGTHSFGGLRARGATTLWEYWPESRGHIPGRSLDHPMFGSPVAHLFSYVLGIRQPEGAIGMKNLLIAPYTGDRLHAFRGSRTIDAGEVTVSRADDGTKKVFTVTVPHGVRAVFRAGEKEIPLHEGEQTISLS